MSIPDHEANSEKLTELLEVKDEEIAELQQENRRVIEGAARESNDVEAELAPALGYEYDEEYGWVTGDHTSVTLAMEASRRIGELRTQLTALRATVLEMRNHYPQEVEEFMRLRQDDSDKSTVQSAVDEQWAREGWG